jgi:N-formylglutamate deformylase
LSELFRFTPATTPLLISVPHCGTFIPPDIAARMTPEALAVPDTDWHVEKLYDFAPALGAGLITATHSRYVVDLNRDPSGKPLYPGADNSELVPLRTFASEPIYLPGEDPDQAEIDRRRETYWQPYHDRIAQELARLRAVGGPALLRWASARFQSRDGQGCDGGRGVDRADHGRAEGRQGIHGGSQRPFHRRLHHAALRTA